MTTIQDPPAEAAVPAVAHRGRALGPRPPPAGPAGRRRRVGRRSWWGAAFPAPHSIGLVVFTAFPIIASLVVSFMNWPMLGDAVVRRPRQLRRLFADPVFRTVAQHGAVRGALRAAQPRRVARRSPPGSTPKITGRARLPGAVLHPDHDADRRERRRSGGCSTSPVARSTRPCSRPSGVTRRTSSPTRLGDARRRRDERLAGLRLQHADLLGRARRGAGEPARGRRSSTAPNAWQTFWRIKFPLISPSIFFATTMTLITSFQVFVQPFVLTKGGPGIATETLVHVHLQHGLPDSAARTRVGRRLGAVRHHPRDHGRPVPRTEAVGAL